ncbi:MAG: FecR domain-containing protein [Odoribacteraceae bacterium]|jgi:ferric-dicitrate binding protein FerR (iron transport regulator)|nr:FecR domain-containing protein [Odoribacteraceae bacterium]
MEKIPENIQALIVALATGRATPGEIAELEAWRATSRDNEEALERALRACHKVFIATAIERGGGMKESPRGHAGRRRWAYRLLPVAAACLLIVAGVYLFRRQPVAEEVPAISPGERKATLTLADGSVWAVRNAALRVDPAGQLAREGTGEMTLVKPRAGGEETGEYHALVVPSGGEISITLPDSTRVWLNSETELRFPATFPADRRVVYLRGEAFFEVAPGGERPFRVELSAGEITVHGTRFNVTDYRDLPLSATLVEGSIDFTTTSGKSVRLQPLHRVVYDAGRDDITVERVNARRYTSWKDNLFYFDGQPLEEIMTVLARWYKVKEVIFTPDESRRTRLSGQLDRHERLEVLLDLFEKGTTLRFTVAGDRVIVSKK